MRDSPGRQFEPDRAALPPHKRLRKALRPGGQPASGRRALSVLAEARCTGNPATLATRHWPGRVEAGQPGGAGSPSGRKARPSRDGRPFRRRPRTAIISCLPACLPVLQQHPQLLQQWPHRPGHQR
jgi:hypothetical protein